MPEWFLNMPHVLQALIASCCTWGMTAAGAALVFCFQRVKQTALDAMMSFSGGVMLAASFFSLLLPAVSMADMLQMNSALIVSAGCILGGIFMMICDSICARKFEENASKRKTLLMLSVTLHNIPEGLAVGVAFGALCYGMQEEAIISACMLAVGIALQNLPEGLAVSAPFLRDGASKRRAFFIGQMSGAVEVLAALAGSMLILHVQSILPMLLAFAAGAMVHVAVFEMIPESLKSNSKSTMMFCLHAGFAVMMLLDIALG